MLLNKLNKKKEKLIWKKYKLDNKLKMKLILFNNMISIIDNLKINYNLIKNFILNLDKY